MRLLTSRSGGDGHSHGSDAAIHDRAEPHLPPVKLCQHTRHQDVRQEEVPVIDGGKLYDWLESRDIEILNWHGGYMSWVPREEFEKLFRQYVAELTDG